MNREEDTISREEAVKRLVALVDTRATTDAEKALVGRCIYIVRQMPPATTCRIEEKTHDTTGGADERKIKILSREEYLKGLAAELKKDGLQVAIKKRCGEIEEEEARQTNYASWDYITKMLSEIIDLAEITDQKPCEYIGNGALKKRGKGFVCYNVEWFKKHWRQELDLMGILPKQKEQEENT